MTPYYQDDAVTLYLGDCREVTDWLAADVLVTDPPYGRDWRQGEIKGHTATFGGIVGDKGTQTRDDALALWGDKRLAAVFGDLMMPPPTIAKHVLVYAKPPDAGIRGAIGGYRRDAEAIYLINEWSSGIGGRSSVIRTTSRMIGGTIGLSTRSGHPHAKPIDVLANLIVASGGVVVADPFAGSGSTLIAAKHLARRAIGVEIEERYCEIAANRLAQGVLDCGGVA